MASKTAKKAMPAEIEKSIETVETSKKTVKKVEKTVEKHEENLEEVPEKSVYEVVGCYKLNIRKEPDINSEILQMLSKGEEIQVIEDKPGEFYKVCTAFGVEGYCMKLYLHRK